jgi:hypothetical protein
MATGTIVAGGVYRRDGRVFAHVVVDEGAGIGRVEYVGSVEEDAAFQALTNAQKKAALQDAVAAERARQRGGSEAIGGITGTVTV